MKVHCNEGIAIHIGPEPCAVIREGVGEASVGDGAGRPLSHEIGIVSGADALLLAEGNTDGRVFSRVPGRPGVVGDPGMCRRSLYGNWEISRLAKRACASLVRIGKVRSRSR